MHLRTLIRTVVVSSSVSQLGTDNPNSDDLNVGSSSTKLSNFPVVRGSQLERHNLALGFA